MIHARLLPVLRRLARPAALAAVAYTALTSAAVTTPAAAWWAGGYGYRGGFYVGLPPVVVAPPIYPPPIYPPAYSTAVLPAAGVLCTAAAGDLRAASAGAAGRRTIMLRGSVQSARWIIRSPRAVAATAWATIAPRSGAGRASKGDPHSHAAPASLARSTEKRGRFLMPRRCRSRQPPSTLQAGGVTFLSGHKAPS